MDCSGKEVCAIVLLLYMIMSWTNINLFTGVEEVEEVEVGELGEVEEVGEVGEVGERGRGGQGGTSKCTGGH